MLKIDLLPPGVREARQARRWIFFPILTLIVALGLGLFLINSASQRRSAAQARRDEWKQKADAVKLIEDEMKRIQAEIQPYVTLAQFCKQFEEKNPAWADVVEAVSRYIMADVTLSRIDVTPQGVSVSGTVPDLETFTRFVMNFQRCRMPAEGGGTEPLWSEDAVSRGALVPLFTGVQVSANVGGGFTTDGSAGVYGAGAGVAAPGAAVAGPPSGEEYEEGEAGGLPSGVTAPAAGATRYVDGVLIVPPISFGITGQLTPMMMQKLSYISLAPAAPAAAPGAAPGAPAPYGPEEQATSEEGAEEE